MSAALEVRGDRRFVIVGQRLALARGPGAAEADRERSRSAGSPALPTAMTTRPQLASSPAMAVLTSGELAIDRPTRRALSSDRAGDRDRDELLRAFAILHDQVRELAADVCPVRRRKASAPGHRRVMIWRVARLAGGEGQHGVAGGGVGIDRDAGLKLRAFAADRHS
jgi:hypothetical protein